MQSLNYRQLHKILREAAYWLRETYRIEGFLISSEIERGKNMGWTEAVLIEGQKAIIDKARTNLRQQWIGARMELNRRKTLIGVM